VQSALLKIKYLLPLTLSLSFSLFSFSTRSLCLFLSLFFSYPFTPLFFLSGFFRLSVSLSLSRSFSLFILSVRVPLRAFRLRSRLLLEIEESICFEEQKDEDTGAQCALDCLLGDDNRSHNHRPVVHDDQIIRDPEYRINARFTSRARRLFPPCSLAIPTLLLFDAQEKRRGLSLYIVVASNQLGSGDFTCLPVYPTTLYLEVARPSVRLVACCSPSRL